MLSLVLGIVALAALGGLAWAWRHRERVRRHREAMQRRLSEGYRPTEPPREAVALRSPPGPPGHVAVGPDGLLVALSGDDAFRSVAWSDVSRVRPAGKGAVHVHISRVGDIAVPSVIGREIWDAVAADAH